MSTVSILAGRGGRAGQRRDAEQPPGRAGDQRRAGVVTSAGPGW
ncbi:MAG TPA: hypothetical protein VFV41_27455 [Streptosporangiaceae bacterium]|nr:hypothetical protein [Streptosporangiaceae bacterium]